MQNIVIFGGSSGIGFELAKRLLEEGNKVILVSRNEEKLQLAKQKLNNKPSVFAVDATFEEQLIAFAEKIEPIDHLIITIRGSNVSGTFAESDTAEVRAAFDQKFWSQYNIIRHCLTKINPQGSIVMTSGIASQRSYSGFYWQACANGAIETLAKTLSAEILPIRINVVSPGFVENKPNDEAKMTVIKQIEPKIPMQRLATRIEIVEGYLYLMKNSYVTGSTLTIDGGILNV